MGGVGHLNLSDVFAHLGLVLVEPLLLVLPRLQPLQVLGLQQVLRLLACVGTGGDSGIESEGGQEAEHRISITTTVTLKYLNSKAGDARGSHACDQSMMAILVMWGRVISYLLELCEPLAVACEGSLPLGPSDRLGVLGHLPYADQHGMGVSMARSGTSSRQRRIKTTRVRYDSSRFPTGTGAVRP